MRRFTKEEWEAAGELLDEMTDSQSQTMNSHAASGPVKETKFPRHRSFTIAPDTNPGTRRERGQKPREIQE